jgi:methionyl-tRNA formyltransferase
MNILILANRDLASHLALNRLLPALTNQHQLALILSNKVGQNRASPSLPERLEQLADFETLALQNIAAANPHKQSTSRQQSLLGFDGFKAIATELPVLGSINDTAGWKQVADFAPDLVLSIRFGLILKPGLIALPKHGVLNLHSGRLPKYRGVMATFRAMQDQQLKIASSLHFIDNASIDSGPIVQISERQVNYQRSYLYNTLALYKRGIEDLLSAVKKIDQGETLHSQTANTTGNYYSFPSAEELRLFESHGHTLFEEQDMIDILQQYTDDTDSLEFF